MSTVTSTHDHHDFVPGPDGQALERPRWRDRKRYAWLLGLIVPLLPFISWGLVELTGLGVFWFFGPVLMFGVFPLIDLLAGWTPRNPPDSVIKWLEQDRYYRWCTYVFLPLQYAGLVFACWLWARRAVSDRRMGLALTVAMVSGIAINTAHELGHKRASSERWLSRVALAQSGYGHFFIEHNRGHHVRVATPEDPASARMGESFYAFWPRTVSGSLRSAWELERVRLERMGSGTVDDPQRHPERVGDDRRAVRGARARIRPGRAALPGDPGRRGLLAAGGGQLPRALRPAACRRREDGRYERTAPEHSWNSNNVASNVLLYHLQRHSDHHANPIRRYQALRHFEEAPQLPTGYAGMILLAMIPPVWRRVMDHRVLEHYQGDLTLRQHRPRARARVLARYGAPATRQPALRAWRVGARDEPLALPGLRVRL